TDQYTPTRHHCRNQQRHHDPTIARACSGHLPSRTSSHIWQSAATPHRVAAFCSHVTLKLNSYSARNCLHLALASSARVSPALDGGYPCGNTAEKQKRNMLASR